MGALLAEKGRIELPRNKLPLKPMKRVLVSDEIINQIRNLILDGTLKPGDPLESETKLAAQMNVGRSTIREALKVLMHLGFLERRNRVAIVSDRFKNGDDPQQIVDRFKKNRNFLEMIEVRGIIEPDIAALAAIRSDTAVLESISKDVEAMRQSLGQFDEFLAHDYHFHLHLAQASGNQILIEIMRGIQDILRKTQAHILGQSDGIQPRSLEFHTKIFDALKAQKPDLAREHMIKHIEDVKKEMYRIMKSQDTG